MEVREIVRVIPEHTERYFEYVASDGHIFHDKDRCDEYEDWLNSKQHIVLKSVENVSLFPDDQYARLYYISTKEEHDYVIRWLGFKLENAHIDEFETFGEGFYFWYCISMGDSHDKYNLLHVDSYLKSKRKEFEDFVSNVETLEERVADRMFGESK